MALSTRQRWMLYGLAALGTGAAMLAVQPPDDAAAPALSAPASRPARSAAATAPALPTAALALPQRPYTEAGRSPFGDPAAAAATAAAAQAAAAAAPAVPAMASAPARPAAPALPFTFLGRWTENGLTTVLLAHGARQLSAVAGRPLTPDYMVEHIGERELRLLHVPTGTRHALALVAGRSAAAAAPGALPAAAESEEQN
ncbi:hypothetical protein [Pseudorhodoferax soli]|uniref:Uncharacterized protein n=1 Tax=Pseudorhodoferax soli TaxID=545864 RepID=A0A368XWA8_9BURK|nr:hypothetical protein [Pseudorhodoferax soli]RCW71338.1 hypothetical protein DES41_104157 [Pseudorhodoferax soli]